MCHTHRTWGTCTIFPQCTSLLLFKLVHASCSVRWIKRSKLGSRLVSANLVAPACWAKRWLAMAPGKSVLACGRTLLLWKWLPVATLPHYHTATLPRCQGRPRWGRPPRSVLGSRQLLLTLGGARARCSRPATSPMESGALAFRQGRSLSAHYSGVDQVARADVGAGDLGSFNKSPPPTQ